MIDAFVQALNVRVSETSGSSDIPVPDDIPLPPDDD